LHGFLPFEARRRVVATARPRLPRRLFFIVIRTVAEMREHLNYIADLKSRSALNAEYFCRKHVASARETLLRLIRVPTKQPA
jgi:DNA-binding GntR family transcriptional regulator